MSVTDTHQTSTREGRSRRFVVACRAGVAAVAVLVATLALPLRPAAADVTFNQRVLELVNRERAAAGLPALVNDPTLAGTAEDAPYTGCGFTVYGRAKDMGDRNYFGHTILDCATQSVFNILRSTGLVYSGAGENVAWMSGTTDPLVAAENLFSQWMNSSGHRANILSASFTKIGVGSWRSAPGQPWSGGGYPVTNVFIGVQVFAGGSVTTTTTAPPTTTPTTTPAPATTPGRFTPLAPARIVDTRDGTGVVAGAIGPGATVDLQVTGRGGVPSTDVSAVAMTVTVTGPTTYGYLTMFPDGTPQPLAANLNWVPGETVSNLVVVKVGSGGRVSVHNPAGTVHVIVDLAGWYSASGVGNAGRFEPLSPSRILDTRTGTGGGARLAPGASLDLQVAGRGGVPATRVQAAVMNMAVTGTTAAGFLTVYPTSEPQPWASTLTFGANTTVSIRTMVKLGAGGKVTIYNSSGSTDVIVDVGGWYTDASVAGTLGALVPLSPARILDTRDATGGVLGPLTGLVDVDVQITGRGGVPASGVRAVVLNATVVSPLTPGYLTIFPHGTARPLAADLNFGAGETQANLVVVKVGASGKVTVSASTATQVIFDVAGWLT